MKTEQAVNILNQLLNHKDLRFLNKAEMIACEQALSTLSEKAKEAETLKEELEKK